MQGRREHRGTSGGAQLSESKEGWGGGEKLRVRAAGRGGTDLQDLFTRQRQSGSVTAAASLLFHGGGPHCQGLVAVHRAPRGVLTHHTEVAPQQEAVIQRRKLENARVVYCLVRSALFQCILQHLPSKSTAQVRCLVHSHLVPSLGGIPHQPAEAH